MQSGFGTGGGGGSGGSGVAEMQQFMVEGGCPSSSSTSIFSISTSNTNLHPHHHHHHHHHHQPHHHSLQPPPHFSHHFQSIPITQQLFHQAHPFQLFSHPHHPELGLDLESGPENSNSGAVQPGSGAPPPPSFLTAAMSFKLGVNDNSSREDDGILHADDASDSHVHPWQREEESTIKEPFWRPLDIDYINNKRSTTNEKQQQQQQQHLQESSSKYYKKTNKEVNEQQGNNNNNNNGSNYKLFSELEAIYKPGNNNVLGGDGSSSANNQTGSGSALTGDENPLMTLVAPGAPISEQQRISTINQISDTSTGEEEAAPMKKHIKISTGRRKRKRRQQQLSSLTTFFENMVKQLMDHQEGLHRKFLEVIEKRDQDRMMREETWRKEEAAKNSRETALRAQERALASSREAAIISFLEKITGETLNLPTKSQFQSPKPYHHSQNEDNNAEHAYDPLDLSQEFMNNNNNNNNNVDVDNNQIHMNSSRWPKAEVHALIRVRSSLEMRFQEPGLKGPLWEEVSSIMATMGYCRSSKRCKEKWENINKYFRKTKESGKKRPLHSKTCPYFHQLDQLYSKSSLNNNNNNNKQLPPPPPTQAGDRKDNSELLDAIVLNNGHEDDDHEDHEGREEEEEDEEVEDDGGKHQHHKHLFESLDS